MNQALYRKWRPQKFSELVGQHHIAKILVNAILGKRIVHAYLFYGPRGTGKTTTARLLAKSVNCHNFKSEPCGECPSCLDFQQGKTMDLVEIDAASNRGIEEIRDLREKIKFIPTKSKYKVFVIDEVHMLTREAFNALLKTLEEPPSHVIFVLATTEIHKVPQTIMSRCQRLDFRRITKADLIKRLDFIAKKEELEIDEGAKEIIAKSAEGSARDAESLLDLVVSRGLSKITKKDAEEIFGQTEPEKLERIYQHLIKKDIKAVLSFVNELNQEGKDLKQLASNLIEYLREKLIENPSLELSKWIRLLCKAQIEMKNTSLLELPLELALVEIVGEEELVEKKLAAEEVPPEEAPPKDEPKKDEPKNDTINTSSNNPLDWNEVISQMRGNNNSLCFILENCQIKDIKDGQIHLCVNFDFHKKKLQEPKNRQIIEGVIKKITGQDFRITCSVMKESQDLGLKDSKNNNNLLDNTKEVFEIEES